MYISISVSNITPNGHHYNRHLKLILWITLKEGGDWNAARAKRISQGLTKFGGLYRVSGVWPRIITCCVPSFSLVIKIKGRKSTLFLGRKSRDRPGAPSINMHGQQIQVYVRGVWEFHDCSFLAEAAASW